MIELRWFSEAEHEPPVLQYRLLVAVDASGAFCPGPIGEWMHVRAVIEPPQGGEP